MRVYVGWPGLHNYQDRGIQYPSSDYECVDIKDQRAIPDRPIENLSDFIHYIHRLEAPIEANRRFSVLLVPVHNWMVFSYCFVFLE